MKYEFTADFAERADGLDALSHYRKEFLIPQHKNEDCIYLCGNSLGLQPKNLKANILKELDEWGKYGVDGHFDAEKPWFDYHKRLLGPTANLMGALKTEVGHMNSLTTNLHLLFASFYRPTKERYKIICEAKAFPSDNYMLESQVNHHGFAYADAVIEVSPREGEHTLRMEDIQKAIDDHSENLALVFFGGVNYYTGQLFDMKSITEWAHDAGAYAGFDLAHAAGNVPMQLHDWDVDFAAWCTYKYLNSGPGGISGYFIHDFHAQNTSIPRFAGWWGYTEKTRFKMEHGFEAIPTAEGWQLSNAPILNMAAHEAALDWFEKAGIQNLRDKAQNLTGYLEFVLDQVSSNHNVNFETITPLNQRERGCQLSVLTGSNGKELFDFLTEEGVVADWRDPNVIRMAPVPLYNSYTDIYRLGMKMEKFFES